jgi:acyl carrier protein
MLFDELTKTIAEVLKLPPEKLTRQTSLARDFGVDSLDVLRIVQALERKYDVDIDSSQLDLMDNLGLAERYLDSLLATRK